MSDWITREVEQRRSQQERQERHAKVFSALAQRLWEALTAAVRHDVQVMNGDLGGVIGCDLEFTFQEPGARFEVTKMLFPSVRLAVELRTYSQSIKLGYSKKAYMGDDPRGYDDLLHLHLDDNDQIHLQADGKSVSIEEASEYLLKPFLEPDLLDRREQQRGR